MVKYTYRNYKIKITLCRFRRGEIMDKRAKILIVEDDNDINKLLCSILKIRGINLERLFQEQKL